ncbi:MAG: NAD(+)/NADH kinase [Treponema sp.]
MKKCLIVVNTRKDLSRKFGDRIAAYLTERGIESSFYSFNGFSEDNPFPGNDFVITLGGDGTVLFAARGCVGLKIPVFPVNFGEFGFIASVQKDEWQTQLDLFLEGKLPLVMRTMVHAALIRPSEKGEVFSAIGLNDVVVCSKFSTRTVLLEVSYNRVPLGLFKADGLIVSTATGSTAYSTSAGGPIIDPELDALLLTPMNAFSLSSRPLVLSPDGEIGITVMRSRESESIITVDGQKPFALREGDCIKIRRINEKVKLAGCTTEKFYGALRSKLNWSGGPHA